MTTERAHDEGKNSKQGTPQGGVINPCRQSVHEPLHEHWPVRGVELGSFAELSCQKIVFQPSAIQLPYLH